MKRLLEIVSGHGIPFHFLHIRQESGDDDAMRAAWGTDNCSFLNYELPIPGSRLWKRKIQRVARKFGSLRPVFPYDVDEWCGDDLMHGVAEVARKVQPTVVQIEYVFFSRLFELFDADVRKILDTHDKMSGRHEVYLKQGKAPEWFYTTRGGERTGLIRADRVLAIKDTERQFFAELAGNRCVTVGHSVDLVRPTPANRTKRSVLFIGSSNEVNRHSLDLLLARIWPTIRAAVPNARLDLVGAICKSVTQPPEGVATHGMVENLDEFYQEARIVVAPMWIGTGLKIKSIEALGRGKPLVSGPAGAEGIEHGAGRAFMLADTPDTFASAVIDLLRDELRCDQLSSGAIEFANAWNQAQEKAYLQALLG